MNHRLDNDAFSDAEIVTGPPHPMMDAIERLRRAGHTVREGDIIRADREGQALRIYRNEELLISEPQIDGLGSGRAER